MTFIIPPPTWVAEELLHIDMPTWMKDITGTALDRKTLVKWAAGEASERTRARLKSDFQRHHPKIAEDIDIFRRRRCEELAALGRKEDFEIENSNNTWRPGIEWAVMAAINSGEPQFAVTVLRDHLLPLEDASIRAEVLWRKGAFGEVLDLVAASALAPFLDLERLRQDAHSCEDAKAFADVFKPVRALACLYILAVGERQFYPRGNRPGFESILPRRDGGALITPMASRPRQLI